MTTAALPPTWTQHAQATEQPAEPRHQNARPTPNTHDTHATADPRADIPAEQALIGAALLDTQQTLGTLQLAQPADFYRPAHETLWHTLQAEYDTNGTTDPVAVAGRLRATGDLQKVGGAPYLHTCVQACTTPAAAPTWAATIRKLAATRRAETALRQALNRLDNTDPDQVVLDAMDALENTYRDAEHNRSTRTDPRLIDAANFLFDTTTDPAPLWGSGENILWARGETLMIAGPTGVGKTTLAQQVVLALLGLQATVLGQPVAQAQRVLYLASDRPMQARKSLRRMLREDQRDTIAGHLLIWKGPPPGNVTTDPRCLLDLATTAKADVIVIDSLKDMAVGIAKDEVGTALNIALQHLLAAGIDVLALHHVRKSEQGSKAEPSTTDELYGSSMIVNGVGSVLSLWGQAGDPIVKLRHLKQPAGEVGPWELLHNQVNGITEISHGIDVLKMVMHSGIHGLTPMALATRLFPRDDDEKPTKNEIEKARRRLDQLVTDGHATCTRGARGRGQGQSTYHALVDDNGEVHDAQD